MPLAVVGYLLLDRRRGQQAARFATAALFPNVVARAPGRLRHIPVAALLLAVTGACSSGWRGRTHGVRAS